MARDLRFELKQVNKVLKTMYSKVLTYSELRQEASFDLFILFSP